MAIAFMKNHRAVLFSLTVGLLLTGATLLSGCYQEETSPPDPSGVEVTASPSDSTPEKDVPYVSSRRPVVERMLEAANVTEDDVVYDLGSGDGRIVITAARKYGARGVGIEIDPERVRESRQNAEEAGVADQVEFREQDMFEADFSDATVVTLYLLPEANRKIRPALFEQLDPGDRVVSHDFDMGAWKPDTTIRMDRAEIHRWTIPSDPPDSLEQEEIISTP